MVLAVQNRTRFAPGSPTKVGVLTCLWVEFQILIPKSVVHSLWVFKRAFHRRMVFAWASRADRWRLKGLKLSMAHEVFATLAGNIVSYLFRADVPDPRETKNGG